MLCNNLKLNQDKTELKGWFSLAHKHKHKHKNIRTNPLNYLFTYLSYAVFTSNALDISVSIGTRTVSFSYTYAYFERVTGENSIRQISK